METYKKGTLESFDLIVSSSEKRRHAYFLRNCSTIGFPEQLDFSWAKKGIVKASITFAISENHEAISLPQSPFGGFWIEESLSSSVLEDFLQAVLIELKGRGILFVRIEQAPIPYEPFSDLINYLLFKSGFKLERMLSHHFFVGKKKIKKRVLKEHPKFQQRVKEQGVKIQMGAIQNFGFLDEIRSWNKSKGYQMIFDDNRLINQVSENPERYFLVTLLKDELAIAHTLSVRLLPDSLFYFLSAVNPKSNVKNIGELLLHCLFQLAVEQKVDFIDLGSSDTDSGPNHNLMFFKSRFSNEICNKTKWTFEF